MRPKTPGLRALLDGIPLEHEEREGYALTPARRFVESLPAPPSSPGTSASRSPLSRETWLG